MAVRLQERDIDLMLGLARNGFMRITQIQNKWFNESYWSCIKRLGKLKKDKYIDVTYIDRFGKGIYYLTKSGLTFINGFYGTEYKQYAKSSKIPHNISCSEFYVNIPTSIEVLDYEIEYYLGEFIPDIYLACRKDNELDVLVEIDNLGRISRFIPKIKKYYNYYESGKWKERFDKFPRCIVVSNSKSLDGKIKEISKIPFRVISFNELKTEKLEQCLTYGSKSCLAI